MSYDDWKCSDPADYLCEFCGADARRSRGWQPSRCTGECGTVWRDPDAEYDQQRDEKDFD